MIHLRARHGRIAAIGLIALVTGSGAFADSAADLAKARAYLLGRGARNWVKERVVVSMGRDRHCTSGETFNFRANSTVDIARCANRVLTTRNVPWTLATAPPIDVNLVFDGKTYQLSFSGPPRNPEMRWRDLARVKPTPTTDILLHLSKD